MSAGPEVNIAADEFEQQRQVSKQLAAPVLEGYEVVAYVGEGTYGDVWQAKDVKSGTLVAIKRLRRQPDHKARSEVRLLAGLDEARGIVALKNIHLDSEPYCYVMEYIGGGTLAARLEQRGKLPFGEAWRIFRELAEALTYVHRHGAVHCDMKPQNVLLDSREMPRLTDFGQARGQGPRGSSLGTRFYMPPEQARLGSPDPRWDVYALGAIFYQMLTGAKPRFNSAQSGEPRGRTQSASEMRDELEKYAEQLEKSPPPLAHRGVEGMTSEVAGLVERCLAVDSARRPKDASEMLQSIARCQWKRRRRPLLILGAVAPALALVVAGLVVIIGGLMALQNFGRRWVAQVLTDNQIVAQTIATEFEARFNERLKVVGEEADDSDWRDLVGAAPNSDGKEAEIKKLRHLFETHGELRLKRWTLVDLAHGRALTYGKLPSGKEGVDECDKVGQVNALAGKGPMLSIPYRRESNESKNVVWVLSVSAPTAKDGEAAAGDLLAEIDYHDFNEVFARVQGSAFFQREIIVANEEGKLLYHQRLAEAVKEEKEVQVRGADLSKPANQFFGDAFAPGGPPLPMAGGKMQLIHRDPWYEAEDATEYFVSRTAANLVNGQKMGVFVLHNKDVAMAGFVQAQRGAQGLGLGLLALGCVMLVGNMWILRRTLRKESGSTDG
jgi:hypothetical protein